MSASDGQLFGPISDVAGFSMRDGKTHLEIQEHMRRSILALMANQNTLNEHVRTSEETMSNILTEVLDSEVAVTGAAITALTNDVTALTTEVGTLSTEVNTLAASVVAWVAEPTGIFVTDTANILAAVNQLGAAGGIVRFREGMYNASLPDVAHITYSGAGRGATEIRCSAGSLLTTATLREGINFEHLTLSTTAGNMIELGLTGGLANGYITDVAMVTYNITSALIHGIGTSSFQSMVVFDVWMSRQTGATVPAIGFTTSSGGMNCNVFDTVTLYSNNCTGGGPFILINATLASYAHDNTFRNIVAEQCPAGIVHLYSPYGVTFENVSAWDASGQYTEHMILVATSQSSGGKAPKGVRASNCGTRYGAMAAGKYHFYCPDVPADAIELSHIGDPNGTSAVSVSSQSRIDPSGASGTWAFTTNDYTLSYNTDGYVLFNGPNLTVTLPAAASTPYAGRKFTIMNSNSTALTVVNAYAPLTIPQWGAMTFITDGATWYRAG